MSSIMAGAVLAGPAAAQTASERVTAPHRASVAAFEAVLAEYDSATEALQQWCRVHGIGTGPIRAEVLGTEAATPPADIRRALGLGPDDPLAMRNVRLTCDGKVLSVAWNWYVPSRLTPDMNAALKASDMPFGRVVADLRFRREALETVPGRAETCPKGTISTHRALLRLPDGRPLAYLIECYTAANLDG